MDAQKIPNSGIQTRRPEFSAASARWSPVRTIALVAVLAGFALADLATRLNTAPDQPSPELEVATAILARGPGYGPEVLLPPSATWHIAGQSASRGGSSGGHIVDTAEVRAVPAANEYYLPARHTNQATSYDGNVMTYEHY